MSNELYALLYEQLAAQLLARLELLKSTPRSILLILPSSASNPQKENPHSNPQKANPEQANPEQANPAKKNLEKLTLVSDHSFEQQLHMTFPQAKVTSCTLQKTLLNTGLAEDIGLTEDIGLAGGEPFDLILANLSLPDSCFLTHEHTVWEIMKQRLSAQGLLFFTALGLDTCHELMLPNPIIELDMHTVGDCLLASGFRDPVMDRQIITIHYQTYSALKRDIHLPLPTEAAFQAIRAATGAFPVSFESIFGHCGSSAHEISISIADIKKYTY